MRIYFCTKGEKEECKVPSSAIAGSPEGFENSNNSTTKDNNNINNNNNNNINNNSSADNNTRTTTKTNSKSGSDSDQLKPNNMFGNDKNNVVNSAGAGSGFIEENIEAGKVEGGRGGVEMQEPPGKGGIGSNTEEEGMKREKENGEGEKKEAGGDGGGTEGMRGWPSGDAGQDVLVSGGRWCGGAGIHRDESGV